jgi:hypothetical protein
VIPSPSSEVDKLVLVWRKDGAMTTGPCKARPVYVLQSFTVLFSRVSPSDNVYIVNEPKRKRAAARALEGLQ